MPGSQFSAEVFTFDVMDLFCAHVICTARPCRGVGSEFLKARSIAIILMAVKCDLT
jgi:hypothetical protein